MAETGQAGEDQEPWCLLFETPAHFLARARKPVCYFILGEGKGFQNIKANESPMGETTKKVSSV